MLSHVRPKCPKKLKPKYLAKKTKTKYPIRKRLGRGALNKCAKFEGLSKTAWTLDSEATWDCMLEPACSPCWFRFAKMITLPRVLSPVRLTTAVLIVLIVSYIWEEGYFCVPLRICDVWRVKCTWYTLILKLELYGQLMLQTFYWNGPDS